MSMKELFNQYMDDKGLSEKTRDHYNYGLTSRIKDFALKYCKDYVSVYDLKKEEAIKLIKQLESDCEFIRYFEKSNGSPISAFHKYIEFLDYLDNESLNYIVGATDDSSSAANPPYNKKMSVWVNRYERNKEERDKCIAEKGLNCYVCGMNFEEIYGDIGHGFIHIHHIEFLSKNGKDISENLIPVCPNCHAMLHIKKNGITMKYEDLKELIKNKKS